MRICYGIFLYFVFTVLSHGYGYCQKETPTEESYRPKRTTSSPEKVLPSVQNETLEAHQHPEDPSLQGSQLPQTPCSYTSNNGQQQAALEVLTVLENQQSLRRMVSQLWTALDPSVRPHICGVNISTMWRWPTAAYVCHFLGGGTMETYNSSSQTFTKRRQATKPTQRTPWTSHRDRWQELAKRAAKRSERKKGRERERPTADRQGTQRQSANPSLAEGPTGTVQCSSKATSNSCRDQTRRAHEGIAEWRSHTHAQTTKPPRRAAQVHCQTRARTNAKHSLMPISGQEDAGTDIISSTCPTQYVAATPGRFCQAMAGMDHRIRRAGHSSPRSSGSCHGASEASPSKLGGNQRRNDGDLGHRGGIQRQARCCGSPERGNEGHAADPRKHQEEGGLHPPRAAAQESKVRSKWRTWQISLYCIGAFWTGQIDDFSVSIGAPKIPVTVSSLVLKLSHSVCSNVDFCNEWQAREEAIRVAWDFGYSSSSRAPSTQVTAAIHNHQVPLEFPQPTFLKSCMKSRSNISHRVHFHKEVQVRYDDMDTSIPCAALQDRSSKPWCLFQDLPPPRQRQTFQIHDTDVQQPLTAEAVKSCPGAMTTTPASTESPDQYQASSREGEQAPSAGTHDLSGPDRNAPDWVHNLWNTIFISQAEKDYEEGDDHITVNTWFLDHVRFPDCERDRAIAFTDEWQAWPEIIRYRWRDRLDWDLPFEVHIVAPEPPRVSGEFHQANLIVTQQRSNEISTLITATFEMEEGPKRLWRQGKVLPARVTKLDVLNAMPGSHATLAHETWVVHGFHIIAHEPHPLSQGGSIEIYKGLPTPEPNSPGARTRTHNARPDPAEHDETSMLARQLHAPPSPPFPEGFEDPHEEPDTEAPEEVSEATDDANDLPADAVWKAVALFKLGADEKHVRVRWNDDEIYHRQVARYAGLSRHELIAIHQVAHGPTDLVPAEVPLLLQTVGQVRPGSSVQYVLLDIEFHNHPPALEADTIRELKLMASRLTRANLLSVFGLIPYCRQVQDTCLVWVNHQLIPVTSQAALNLRHGDYIRIAVPPPPGCPNTPARLAALVHHHELGAEDYDNIQQEMPEDMSLEQMPNPLNIIDHLPFVDDPTALLQTTIGKPTAHRVPEDTKARIEKIIQLNEQNRVAARDNDIMDQLDQLPASLRDLHGHLLLAAVQHPEEEPPRGIMTWYLSHEHAHRCNIGRPVVLDEEPTHWRQQISSLWEDEMWPDDPVAYYIVTPKPLDIEHGIAAHVLVVQHEYWDRPDVALLMTLFDSGVSGGRALRFAFIHQPLISHGALLHTCDRDTVCSWQDTRCQSWFGWYELTQRPHIVAHNGYGFNVAIQRAVRTECKHHDQPVRLCLDELLPAVPRSCAVELIAGAHMPHLPPFIVLRADYDAEDVQLELHRWGLTGTFHQVPGHDKVLCMPPDFQPEGNKITYIFANKDPSCSDGTILHSAQHVMTEIEIMKFLYQLGYQRAAVLEHYAIEEHFYQVIYKDVIGNFDDNTIAKPQKAWPMKQSTDFCRAPVTDQLCGLKQNDTQFKLRFHRSIEDVCDLLQSGQSLCTDWQQLDLPPEITAAITACDEWNPQIHLDRLIIYTDGSSSASRHSHPERCDGPDTKVDSWAFVVLGEHYDSQKIYFLGWQAQPILYGNDKEQHLGADRVGSEITEREALFWALLWRIGRNSYIPTVFRPDNTTVIGQAQGTYGAQHRGTAFTCLRGAYQLLDNILPPGDLQLAHVRGHCGDVWNDFADIAAKSESRRSHYLPRQGCDIRLWLDDFPYLWTLFAKDHGLPPLTSEGHCPHPPDLPGPLISNHPDSRRPMTTTNISLSLCSGNVQSLYKGPDGHSGKLDYLRAQMKELHFNICGIQEARSEAGTSFTNSVIRFASGADKHNYGVELWINMDQPYAHKGRKPLYFARNDFVIVKATPRLLIAHVVNDHLDIWLIVGHAPQSGRAAAERQAWWSELCSFLEELTHGEPILAMLDANAATGPSDDHHIGPFGDAVSHNTPFLRDMLERFNLCLPATFPCHQGPQTTWIRADGAIECRIDYIAIPQDRLHQCQLSRVVQEFDLGNEHDHTAVALELTWTAQAPLRASTPTQHTPRRTWHIEEIRSFPAETLKSYAIAPWQCDVGTHVDTFNHGLHLWMQTHSQPRQAAAKKIYITDEIWTCRQEKLQTRRSLRHQQQLRQTELLRACFAHWQQARPNAPSTPSLGYSFVEMDTKILCTSALLQKLSKQLKRALCQTKRQALQQCLEALPSGTSASAILRALKPHIGPSNPKKHKKAALPIVRQTDGTLCTTPAAALDRWVEHFMGMEGGQRLDPLTQHEIWTHNLKELQAERLDLTWNQLPSLADLEEACRKVALGKAIGPDGLPSDLFHWHPAALARHLYPQLLKLVLHGQESIVHKGGKLVAAYKHKGPHDNCESYRSLLISSHAGKVLHKTLRSQECPNYERYLQAQQLGGRRKVPVQLALHATRAFLRTNRQQGRCVGILFLDLKEAFYRVVRGLVTGQPTEDQLLTALSQRLGLTTGAQEQLRAALCEAAALDRANIDTHAQRAIRALHCDTHFHLHGQTDVCRTNAGTRPGDSWADVIFGFAWARLLHRVQEELSARHILDVYPGTGPWMPFSSSSTTTTGDEVAFLGATWMDDLSLCVSGSDCATVEANLRYAASVLIDQCLNFGMTPNLSKGKTEILFSFQGKNSRQARLRYFGGAASGTFPVIGDEAMYHINVVGDYTHLGNLIHHSGIDSKEMRRRMAIAHQAFGLHRRAIYHNAAVPMRKKLELFESLIISKLLYGAETWIPHTIAAKEQFHAGVMRLYRRLGRYKHDGHLRETEILEHLSALSPSELLRRQRLRYLGTLHQCSANVPWPLLHLDSEWGDLVRSDVEWMHEQLSNASHLPDPATDFQPWHDIIVHHPGYWKRLIKRACTHAMEQRGRVEKVRQLHEKLLTTLEEHGPLTVARPHRAARQVHAFFGCLTCGLRCRSKGGEAAHMFKSHGIAAAHRKFCEGSQCPHCLKELHTHSRLCNHMRHSQQCRRALQARRVVFDQQPGHGSTHNSVQENHHNGLSVAQQAAGPLLPAPPRDEEPHHHGDIFRLLAELALTADASDFSEQVHMAIEIFPVSWTLFNATMDWFLTTLAGEDRDLLGMPYDMTVATCRRLQEPDNWSIFAHTGAPAQSGLPLEAEHYEDWAYNIAVHPDDIWTQPPKIQRQLFREKVVLHLFSGRRRHGDLQFFLDRAASRHPDRILYVVSVDIIIDDTWGDVRDVGTSCFWLDAIRCGYVIGMIAGPPCNTWSRARKQQLETSSGRRGPRVVREGTCMWGLISLTLRELADVRVGNDLLGFSLYAFLLLYLSGNQGIIEHPAESPDECDASIWRLPLVTVLLKLPGVSLEKLWQGLFGAETTKPTFFMTAHCQNFVSCLHPCMVTREPPRGGSIGVDSSGAFKTARLKEYPPALNRGLAQVFLQTIEDDFKSTEESSIPPGFLDRCRMLTCTEYGESIGRDFAGS